MDDEVTRYIDKLPSWQIDVCRQLRATIHKAIPAVEERIRYGNRTSRRTGSMPR
ncbi:MULTISPECIES: hypothetical protein [Nocardia]|uniref:hypothetical protein n=1 Tax=Nocardia TaxID=1817 RepID=UPI001E526D9F|nr:MULTISPECIES: hypothetical protein [Nocardia]